MRESARSRSLVERMWWGTDPLAGAMRVALSPLSMLFGAAARARGALYDRGVLRTHETAVPAVSVGNLTVGGTGKTPVAAWIASTLRALGGTPAVVLRGYGADEPRVHAILNPELPVVVSPDRVAGCAHACAIGCDIAVLDDAFQHRRAQRVADMVLVSAEQWARNGRVLPAGPLREPVNALRRATMVVVTRKSASADEACGVEREIRARIPRLEVARVHLRPDRLARLDGAGEVLAIETLRGSRVLALAGVGDPEAFFAQLREAGATVVARPFPDHHAFDARDASRLAAEARSVDRVVCTLKDAVKLAPLWAAAAVPLWYVSQRIELEDGGDALERLLLAALAARPVVPSQPVGIIQHSDANHDH